MCRYTPLVLRGCLLTLYFLIVQISRCLFLKSCPFEGFYSWESAEGLFCTSSVFLV